MVNKYMKPHEKEDLSNNYGNFNHRRTRLKKLIRDDNMQKGLDEFDLDNAIRVLIDQGLVQAHEISDENGIKSAEQLLK